MTWNYQYLLALLKQSLSYCFSISIIIPLSSQKYVVFALLYKTRRVSEGFWVINESFLVLKATQTNMFGEHVNKGSKYRCMKFGLFLITNIWHLRNIFVLYVVIFGFTGCGHYQSCRLKKTSTSDVKISQ